MHTNIFARVLVTRILFDYYVARVCTLLIRKTFSCFFPSFFFSSNEIPIERVPEEKEIISQSPSHTAANSAQLRTCVLCVCLCVLCLCVRSVRMLLRACLCVCVLVCFCVLVCACTLVKHACEHVRTCMCELVAMVVSNESVLILNRWLVQFLCVCIVCALLHVS